MKINSFKINKLHGSLNFELIFKDNTLILLGENGSCKTTIIKMMYYSLSLQWSKLRQYDFKNIEINIGNAVIHINKEDISFRLNESIMRKLRKYPFMVRRIIISAVQDDKQIDIQAVEKECVRHGIPFDMILETLTPEDQLLYQDNKKEQSTSKNIHDLKSIMENIYLLYLPTYRRIEQDLKVVLEGRIDEDEFRSRSRMDSEQDKRFSELIEFGMRDVDLAVTKTVTSLKESSRSALNDLTLSYLGDIVDEKYTEISVKDLDNMSDGTIRQIMDRVDKSILSSKHKEKILNTLQRTKEHGIKTEHDKVVSHYFLRLFKLHNELTKNESFIRKFVDICNIYLENKKMYYDSPTFNFSIKSNHDDKDIKLFQLSSGEKQIVSLFSHLYLSNHKQYFILIDEPELSLSVKWQKLFLTHVRESDFCKGLIAVTHSPFIFDNNLDKYAHGLEEFRK